MLADAPTATTELATGFNMDTLREGDDVKFVCNYQSNPEATSIEWLHNVSKLTAGFCHFTGGDVYAPQGLRARAANNSRARRLIYIYIYIDGSKQSYVFL